jgi:hypothetical protein
VFPGLLRDLVACSTPATVPWKSSPNDWLDTFDWDVLVLNDDNQNLINFNIELCSGFFPCFINVDGRGNTLLRTENGSISCLASNDCVGVIMQSLKLTCNQSKSNESESSATIFTIHQSDLIMRNVTCSSCVFGANGGVIQSHGRASLLLEQSRFANLRTSGSGAAVSFFGGRVKVTDSSFANCVADQGGGAIWASTMDHGYGGGGNTELVMHSSAFYNCTSAGPGGAILISSLSEYLGRIEIEIDSTNFTGCAGHVGGALATSGPSASVRMTNCNLILCRALDMGGALSIRDSAVIEIMNSLLERNLAQGMGGGAVHLSNARFLHNSSFFIGNSAPAGGGGIIYWQGTVNSELMSYKDCGTNNTAQYGPCIASGYKKLEVGSSISSTSPVIPGMPVCFKVTKVDSYGQIIASDNSSLITVHHWLGSQLETSDARGSNSSMASSALERPVLGGSLLFPMIAGIVNACFTIMPVFARVSVREGIATIGIEPTIYFQGVDSETCSMMKSSSMSLPTSAGREVCPPGYIIFINSKSNASSSGPGTCRLCGHGTYSANPLTKNPSSTSNDPSCIPCPAGADCNLGGSQIRFPSGIWALAENGLYILESCPAGHQLINSTSGTSFGTFSYLMQQCRVCLPGEYIVDPNHDACQKCPPGCSFVLILVFNLKDLHIYWNARQNIMFLHAALIFISEQAQAAQTEAQSFLLFLEADGQSQGVPGILLVAHQDSSLKLRCVPFAQPHGTALAITHLPCRADHAFTRSRGRSLHLRAFLSFTL